MANRIATVGSALAAALIAGSVSAAAGPPATGMARRPDHAAVLQGAFDRALADGSNGALILFIARNPDEALTAEARAALAARTAPDRQPFPGPDGDIIAAFDRARLAGPSALAAFAAGNAPHPLAAEALRPYWQ